MSKHCLFENGELKFLEAAACKIPANDAGANFGDGVYEVIAFTNNNFVDFELHMARLKISLEGVGIQLPKKLGIKQIESALIQLLAENEIDKADEGYVYFRISRGTAELRDFKITETIPGFFAEWHNVKLYKQQKPNDGETALAVPDTRWFFKNLKTLQLMPARLSKRIGDKANAHDVVFINHKNIVTEGGSSNLFIVKNGEILTHPADNAILAGITRLRLIELAEKSGYTIRETKFTLDDLLASDEVFRSSTSLGARGISKIVIKELSHKILSEDADLWQPAKAQYSEHKIGNGLVGAITLDLAAKYAEFARASQSASSDAAA